MCRCFRRVVPGRPYPAPLSLFWGFALRRHQHLSQTAENAKQPFFKIPPRRRGGSGGYICLLNRATPFRPKKKGKQLPCFTGEWRGVYKKKADLGEREGGRNTKGEKGRRGCHQRTHRVSDKTLLDLFVLLGFSDESHLLRLTAREVHIKEEPSTDKCLFFSPHNE